MPVPSLAEHRMAIVRVQPQFPVDLLLDPLRRRPTGRSILLITGMMVEVVLHGQVEVGQGLGLHPLGGVHQEQHALAGGQGPGDLVGEIHVARGVDQIELVLLAVLGACRAG